LPADVDVNFDTNVHKLLIKVRVSDVPFKRRLPIPVLQSVFITRKLLDMLRYAVTNFYQTLIATINSNEQNDSQYLLILSKFFFFREVIRRVLQ